MIARYLGWILLLGVAGMATAWLLGGRFELIRSEALYLGIAVATAGAVAGILLTAWTFHRSQKQFMAALVLGMVGRVVIYGAALVYVALRTAIDPVAMAAALIVFYLIHHVLRLWDGIHSSLQTICGYEITYWPDRPCAELLAILLMPLQPIWGTH